MPRERWQGNRLYFDGRLVAEIVADPEHPNMWRLRLTDGPSDIVNRARAKDAAASMASTASRSGRRHRRSGGRPLIKTEEAYHGTSKER